MALVCYPLFTDYYGFPNGSSLMCTASYLQYLAKYHVLQMNYMRGAERLCYGVAAWVRVATFRGKQ